MIELHGFVASYEDSKKNLKTDIIRQENKKCISIKK